MDGWRSLTMSKTRLSWRSLLFLNFLRNGASIQNRLSWIQKFGLVKWERRAMWVRPELVLLCSSGFWRCPLLYPRLSFLSFSFGKCAVRTEPPPVLYFTHINHTIGIGRTSSHEKLYLVFSTKKLYLSIGIHFGYHFPTRTRRSLSKVVVALRRLEKVWNSLCFSSELYFSVRHYFVCKPPQTLTYSTVALAVI